MTMGAGSGAGIDRRALIAGLGATALAGCAGTQAQLNTPPPPPAPGALNSVPTALEISAAARSRGRRFGSAVAAGAFGTASFADRDYANLLSIAGRVVVAENEMKWQAVRPGPGQFDFAAFDRIVAGAEARSMAVRGHTLLWHRPRWMPDWVNTHDYGVRPATAAAAMLVEHIETVTRRYGTRIHSYDVVNEVVEPSDGSLVPTSMSQAMGGITDTVDLAFRTARAAAPHAELVYNDYMGWEASSATHRAGILRLLEGFRARGTPVDTLGLQSHLTATADPREIVAQQREWRAFLDAVVAMGYRLIITELDVSDEQLVADVARRDQQLADNLAGYLDVSLDYGVMGDVLTWGLVDRYSWLQSFRPRSDGLPQRCCPFDDMYRAKRMARVIADKLGAARPVVAASAT